MNTHVRKGPVEESKSAFVKLKGARPSQMTRVARVETTQRNTENAGSIVQVCSHIPMNDGEDDPFYTHRDTLPED